MRPSTVPRPTAPSPSWRGKTAALRRAVSWPRIRFQEKKRPAGLDPRGVFIASASGYLGASLNRTQDEEQDERTDDGGDEAADIPSQCELTTVEQQSEDQAAKERADNADDDVAQPPLPGVVT